MTDVLLHAYTHTFMYTILRLNGNSANAHSNKFGDRTLESILM